MACIRKRRGKWVADFRDGAGIRHWKSCETKREAEDYLAKAIPESRQWSQLVVEPRVTLEQYAERWLRLIQPTVKRRTYTRYEELWRIHLRPAFGEIKVRQLHRGRIMGFLAGKLTEELARNTVRNIHATLRAMLQAAVDDGLLLANPAEKLGRQLRLVVPKATRQEVIKAMTRDERQRFLLTSLNIVPRYAPLFFTLAGTGMRLGEALAQKWGDIDVLAREIRVARALSAGEIDTPKSGHGRTVDLSQSLAAWLGSLKAERDKDVLLRGVSRSMWVFCSLEGTLLDDSNVRKAMSRVLKVAGLSNHFTPHCLRHTYASLMLQQGESINYVQRQLGHASIQLTVDTYGKWLPMGNKAAVDRLDTLPMVGSGSKMVATEGGESRKLWSWREESNLQPAVYK
ncbi:MAG: tyrosine-type recombinase/integrase, partial [Nitrospira sp.]